MVNAHAPVNKSLAKQFLTSSCRCRSIGAGKMATSYNLITVKGLRDILKDRGLEHRGLKAELIVRLNHFDRQDAASGGAQQVLQPSSQQ
jgi:hypothetical protein